jgi:cytochrome c-type biogenesis protein CcmH
LFFVCLSAGLIVMLGALMVLLAGTAEDKPWAYDLAAELMSPYCPGRTLASCPSPQAAELIQWVVLQEAAGSSQEEVIAVLIERFGEEILAFAPAKGIMVWAYVLPILIFVVGGGLVVFVMRRIVGGNADEEIVAPISTVALTPPGPSSADSQVASARNGSVHDASPDLTDDELARMVDEDLAARG